MNAQRWLDRLASTGDSLVGDVFGYHSVDSDWRIDYPNGLTEHLIYLVVAGECVGTVGRRPVRLGPGDALWLPPRVAFGFATVGTPMTLYRFRLAASARDPRRALVVPQAWELRAPLDALVAELDGDLPHRAHRVRALLVVVFTSLLRLSTRPQGQAPLSGEQRTSIERHVDAHIADRLRVADLAALVGLSEDYFVRRFRQAYGMPPKSWLVRRRINHAALRLDESDDPITLVARRFGYPDGFLFSRQFKSVLGVSPRAWRARDRA